MKQTAKAGILLAIMTLGSCSAEIGQENDHDATLNISVKTSELQTKAPIHEGTLPDAAEIGVFLKDGSGNTYGTTTPNTRFTAAGTGSSQVWTPDSDVQLRAENGTLYAYHPYGSAVNSITAVPIDAASQTDWMWATPTTAGMASPSAELTMNHATALLAIVMKRGDYDGTAALTALSVTSSSLASSAQLNITNGALGGFSGAGSEQTVSGASYTLTAEGTTSELLVIPTAATADITIRATIDALPFTATAEDIGVAQGKITTVTLTLNRSELSVASVNITPWTNGTSTTSSMTKPHMPKISISGSYSGIDFERSYADGVYTIRATAQRVGHSVKTVTFSGTATMEQSVNGNGIRTITLTDIQSDITLSFSGTSYLEWARIQHVDGTLYTAEEWLAAEAAGTVTDADANGVAVKYSQYAPCPHVIHPNYSAEKMEWSSNTSVEVPGVYTTTFYDTSDKSSCNYDIAGKANTDALLAAVTAGTIAYAPAAQWASQVVFADGSQGYLPAAGEVYAWMNNKKAINACMDAIGGDQVGVSPWNYTWTSTQRSSSNAWSWNRSSGNVGSDYKGSIWYVRAVCAFSI